MTRAKHEPVPKLCPECGQKWAVMSTSDETGMGELGRPLRPREWVTCRCLDGHEWSGPEENDDARNRSNGR